MQSDAEPGQESRPQHDRDASIYSGSLAIQGSSSQNGALSSGAANSGHICPPSSLEPLCADSTPHLVIQGVTANAPQKLLERSLSLQPISNDSLRDEVQLRVALTLANQNQKSRIQDTTTVFDALFDDESSDDDSTVPYPKLDGLHATRWKARIDRESSSVTYERNGRKLTCEEFWSRHF